MTTADSARRVLYRSYGVMNRVCWHGALPPCLLTLSFRMSPRTLAYAARAGRAGEYPRIVFNARCCRIMGDADFLQLMAHEMIHIRQFSLGGRGGHGRDFQDEQRRLGLILGAMIPENSPFGYVLFMHGLRMLRPAEAVRMLADDPGGIRADKDFFDNNFKLLYS